MKYFETHFEDYVSTCLANNFHPKIQNNYEKFPISCLDMKNLILYGPSGSGKYSQALCIVNKYSPSKLKYEKKTVINFNKQDYCFKLSDIHYEIDLSLLGCNAKMLWHEIYNQIVDIIGGTSHKTGIILCKNVHVINNDLMDVLYSYMQNNTFSSGVQVKYIFLTESLCFFPDCITNCCECINVPRPNISKVKKHVKMHNTSVNEEDIAKCDNIKNLYSVIKINNVSEMIIKNITTLLTTKIKDINFSVMREYIYELFIYDVNVHKGIWDIICYLINNKLIKNKNINVCLEYTYSFFKLYNNNYRPIYHVESYLYKLILLINE